MNASSLLKNNKLSFQQGDALKLKSIFHGEARFNTILDSCVFHCFDHQTRLKYAAAVAAVLKIGGRLLYSVPSKRLDVVAEDRDANGRLFIPNQSQRLLAIFENIGFVELKTWANADSLGRDAVEWESVLLERKT
jgi:SAM-dependent methyltransferase